MRDQNAKNYRNDRGKLGMVATNVPPINIDIGLDGKVGMNAVEGKVSEQEMREEEVNQDTNGRSEIEKSSREWKVTVVDNMDSEVGLGKKINERQTISVEHAIQEVNLRILENLVNLRIQCPLRLRCLNVVVF